MAPNNGTVSVKIFTKGNRKALAARALPKLGERPRRLGRAGEVRVDPAQHVLEVHLVAGAVEVLLLEDLLLALLDAAEEDGLGDRLGAMSWMLPYSKAGSPWNMPQGKRAPSGEMPRKK